MWRLLHSILALGSLLFVLLLALTGTFLAVVPVADALSPAVQQAGELSVADVLHVLERYPEPDRLDRLPSGAVTLVTQGPNGPERHLVDIRSGASLGLYAEDPLVMLVKELHRSLLLGQTGRAAAGLTALVMAILCVSGFVLLWRRQGGWSGLFGPVRGRFFERLHALSGRLSLLPFLFMAVTALYLSLVSFGVISNGQEIPPAAPESLEELDPVPPASLHALQALRFDGVKTVIFPIPGDWFDVFTVTTAAGHIFIDQFTGDILAEEPLRPGQIGLDWMKALHTGEGIAPLAALLGLSALAVPVFVVSGLAIWIGGRRRAGPRVRNNASARTADTIILVGSENGSTWGFARHLHDRLSALGRAVHIGSLDGFSRYPKASLLLALTSTYGDGNAPKSARGFLKALTSHTERPAWKYAVLGFGDSSFLHFARFAEDADAALARIASPLLPRTIIDRESAQSFERWGVDLGRALGLALTLDYEPPRPPTQRLALVERRVLGAATGTPTAILRFAPPAGARAPNLKPGDLVAILPPDSRVARFYSAATGRPDGQIEICVRLLDSGLCSGFLHALRPGDSIDMFVRENPEFHAPAGPLLLVANGTGIAPFIGMIRANARRRPIHLYWGGRDPASDFLYEDEIAFWLADKRLTAFSPAFSRAGDRRYVQDRVRQDRAKILEQLQRGATIMVCGSAAMAHGVREAFDQITGTDTARLRAARRYREDIF